jgi:hypothetical protein
VVARELSVVGKHLHCSFVFEMSVGNAKLFFEIFVSCKSIPDGWLADNWKFTVGTVTAKLKSS